MSPEAKTKLIGFVQNELARGHQGLNVERDSLIDSGVIDSLGIMKLVQFLEKEFSVRIADDELLPENFEFLEAIERLVDSKR